MSLNTVILSGNLGQDPTIRGADKKVATLRLAIDKGYKNSEGEYVEKTDWVNVTVFRPGVVNWIEKRLKKGDKIAIQGGLAISTWTDKHDQNRTDLEVHVDRTPGHKVEGMNLKPSEQAQDDDA